MPRKIDVFRFLGMPRSTRPEELVARCQELQAWLRSEAVPESLRPWAREQAALVAGFSEALAEEVAETESAKITVALPEAAEAGEGDGGFLRRLLRSPLFFAGLGVLLGAAVLVGVLLVWQRGEPDTSAQNGQTEMTSAEYLASQQERLKELEALVAQQPANADALFELGEINMLGEQWEEAILWFQKLLAVAPDSPYTEHVQIDVALASMSLGRYNEAEALFLKVLEKNPEEVRTHFSLGFLYSTAPSPNMRDAVTHWQEVVRLAPGTELATIATTHLEQAGALLPAPFTTPSPTP